MSRYTYSIEGSGLQADNVYDIRKKAIREAYYNHNHEIRDEIIICKHGVPIESMVISPRTFKPIVFKGKNTYTVYATGRLSSKL